MHGRNRCRKKKVLGSFLCTCRTKKKRKFPESQRLRKMQVLIQPKSRMWHLETTQWLQVWHRTVNGTHTRSVILSDLYLFRWIFNLVSSLNLVSLSGQHSRNEKRPILSRQKCPKFRVYWVKNGNRPSKIRRPIFKSRPLDPNPGSSLLIKAWAFLKFHNVFQLSRKKCGGFQETNANLQIFTTFLSGERQSLSRLKMMHIRNFSALC